MSKIQSFALPPENIDGKVFWRKEIPSPAPALDLQLDFQRPPVRTVDSENLTHQFSADFFQKFKTFVHDKSLSEDKFLFTLFAAFVHRFSRQPELILGRKTDAGNVVPIYIEFQTNQTFEELYAVVDQKFGAIAKVTPQSLEEIIEYFDFEDDPARPPLVEVVFGFSRSTTYSIEDVEDVEDVNEAEFDLNFEIVWNSNECAVAMTFNGSLYSFETMRNWCRVVEMMGQAVIEKLWDAPVGLIPVISSEDRQKVLYEWNQTEAEYEADGQIDRLFENQAEKTPDAPAIIVEGQATTFRELNEKANQIAHYLVKQGVEQGQAIGISLPRSVDMISALLGVLKAGCFYVALDPNYPTGRLQFMVSNSKIETLISTTQIATELLTEEMGDINLVGMDTDLENIEAMLVTNLGVVQPPASPLYILYTSGSTGVPKGVIGHHRSAINRLNWMWREYPFVEGEVYPQKTTLNFVDSIWEIWGPLLKGVPLLLIPDEIIGDPQQFIPILQRYKTRRLIMVPSILKILLDDFPDLGQRLTDLKFMTFSGEPVSIDLYNSFKRSVPGGVMLNLYGASECAADGTFCDDIIHHFEDRVPIGRPIDNTKIYILDEQMEPVPIGMSGEIYVSGDCVALGYYNRPDLTAERFLQDPFSGVDGMTMFKTGDFGRYLSNSQIEYLGRSDSQVKIRGIRIELGEIEKTLNKNPLVKQSIVLVKQDRLGDKALAAYLKVEPSGLDLPSSFWRSHMLDHLPNYMIPPYFVTMLEFPHTPNGKINRTGLPDPVKAMEERQAREHQEAGDDIELDDVDEKMLSIWRDTLETENVHINDDFFDLGGQSVLAVRLFKQINQQLGVQLDLSVMFNHSTPRGLANLVKGQVPEANQFEHLITINKGSDNVPKFYCVHGAGGNVLFFQGWVKYLGDTPFYAFQSAGVDGATDLPQSIEEIAQNYVADLRRFQPEGPYWLGGYSVGGTIALEMAHQLLELGESITHITLLDTLHPHVFSKKLSIWDHLNKARQDLSIIGDFANSISRRLMESQDSSDKIHLINTYVENGETMPIELRESFLYLYYEGLEKKYQPTKTYDGAVTLFRANEVWEMYSHVADDGDWGDLLPNLTIKKVLGDHFTIVNEPGIEELVSEIKGIVNSA